MVSLNPLGSLGIYKPSYMLCVQRLNILFGREEQFMTKCLTQGHTHHGQDRARTHNLIHMILSSIHSCKHLPNKNTFVHSEVPTYNYTLYLPPQSSVATSTMIETTQVHVNNTCCVTPNSNFA